MKSFVSYTNCVGVSIWNHFLKPNLPDYTLHEFTNYELIRDKTLIPVDVFRNADVFMYQPIDERHGIYHTTTEKGVLQYLKPSCIRICLPVVGADMFPIYEDFGVARGPNLDRSIPLSVHLFNYDSHTFSFDLRKRFDRGMEHMRFREQMCNIKVVDFILANYQQHRLFLSQNHPSGILLAYIGNQTLKLLGIPKQYDIFAYDHIVLGDAKYHESEYMKRELGLKYPIQDDHGFYRKMLIYFYNHPELARPTKTMPLK